MAYRSIESDGRRHSGSTTSGRIERIAPLRDASHAGAAAAPKIGAKLSPMTIVYVRQLAKHLATMIADGTHDVDSPKVARHAPPNESVSVASLTRAIIQNV